jgi:hypothetical protein
MEVDHLMKFFYTMHPISSKMKNKNQMECPFIAKRVKEHLPPED